MSPRRRVSISGNTKITPAAHEQRRLSVAKVTATDEELIAQAVREGRVRRLSPKESEPEPEPVARNWKNPSPPVGEQRWLR